MDGLPRSGAATLVAADDSSAADLVSMASVAAWGERAVWQWGEREVSQLAAEAPAAVEWDDPAAAAAQWVEVSTEAAKLVAAPTAGAPWAARRMSAAPQVWTLKVACWPVAATAFAALGRISLGT
ncbi:MAG: hypothetical protein WAK19_16045 [Candidatus Cybelea sp.]